MSSRRTTLISLSVLVVFGATVLTPLAALASSEGRRNTALALTAGTVYSVVTGKKTAAIATGAGAAYAWKRYTDSRKDDAYRNGYNDGRYGYRSNRSDSGRYYSNSKSSAKYCSNKSSKKHYGWSKGKHKGWYK